MLRDDYVAAIKEAGFEEVEVLEENQFATATMLDAVRNDPTMSTFIEEAGVSDEDIKNIAKMIVSIKVKGTKA
jgi:hypothetical protein